MTPAPPQRRTCQNCNSMFLQPARPGRPSTMCSEDCKRAARRKNGAPPDLTRAETDMNETAENLNHVASNLLAAVQDRAPSAHLLHHITVLHRLIDDAEAAAVRRGRMQGNTWDTLAEPVGLSPERLRKRWTEAKLTRRLDTRRTAREALTALTQEARLPMNGATPSTATPRPPTQTPAQQLASAFSHLQRESGQTLKETAASSDVSPSYLSRILSGERNPTWTVAARLTHTYKANLEEIHDLWQAAQRPPDTEPPIQPPAPRHHNAAKRRFQVALRALYLAADRPTLYALRSATGNTLTVTTIGSALNGSTVPNWPTTSRLIAVLHGCPADLRPLWHAAYQPDDQGPHLPAGSFG
ncbi:helix-turn-helix transcriptional regulator [Streptomyces decoyicus]|uniref:Helix-turn-helix transcriptional regulator n=1 Tax=Streptomyces decoyicus TaxID=249567 RepID=A0ABZ1F8V3_9ACTN|nr:helix-turn-helix transcriptional regulator [Streptomyces decoyicus]WSB66529.1 helix-turn-helix transcriptional regulator [Streptomyces decoyicus]